MTPDAVHHLQNGGLACARAVVNQVNDAALDAHELNQRCAKRSEYGKRMWLKAGHVVDVNDLFPLIKRAHRTKRMRYITGSFGRWAIAYVVRADLTVAQNKLPVFIGPA